MAQMGYLFWNVLVYSLSHDASVNHVAQQYMAFVERPPIEIVSNGGAKVEEDRMEWILVGGVENANNPLTVVLELVACDSSPVVRQFSSSKSPP